MPALELSKWHLVAGTARPCAACLPRTGREPAAIQRAFQSAVKIFQQSVHHLQLHRVVLQLSPKKEETSV